MLFGERLYLAAVGGDATAYLNIHATCWTKTRRGVRRTASARTRASSRPILDSSWLTIPSMRLLRPTHRRAERGSGDDSKAIRIALAATVQGNHRLKRSVTLNCSARDVCPWMTSTSRSHVAIRVQLVKQTHPKRTIGAIGI